MAEIHIHTVGYAAGLGAKIMTLMVSLTLHRSVLIHCISVLKTQKFIALQVGLSQY